MRMFRRTGFGRGLNNFPFTIILITTGFVLVKVIFWPNPFDFIILLGLIFAIISQALGIN